MGKPFKLDGTPTMPTTDRPYEKDPGPPAVVKRAADEGRSVGKVCRDVRAPDTGEAQPWGPPGRFNDAGKAPMKMDG